MPDAPGAPGRRGFDRIPRMSTIGPDSHVTLHYRMSVLVDGVERELVNTFASAPATLQMGVGQWSPDVEQRLVGLQEGQKLDVEIAAAEAYGVHNPDLVYTLDREQLAEQCGADLVYEVGETVELHFAGEAPVRGTLARCDDDSAVVDFNHPLAGRALHLNVQVIGIL